MGLTNVGLFLSCLCWLILFSLSQGYDCITGYYKSNRQCVPCHSTCRNGDCDRNNGMCTDCYYSSFCTSDGCDGYGYCRNCITGYYKFSWWCVQCRSTCLNGVCDRNSGTCKGCVDGRRGKWCNMWCSSYCKDNQCDQNTGQCIAGCVDGRRGKWCNIKCSSYCKDNQCDQNTGQCIAGCKDDWHGEKCSRRCSSNCKHNSCIQNTGHCIGGCKEGYHGDKCQDHCHTISDKCTSCTRDGHCTNCTTGFGNSCSSCQTIHSHCSQCTKEGVCTNCKGNRKPPGCKGCKEGYYGYKCNRPCSDKTRHCNKCTQDGKCSECSGNLRVPHCTECADGYYKDSDREMCHQCSGTCYKNETCNRTTGFCNECPAGKTGNHCEQVCKIGWYGEGCNKTCGHCKGADCHHVTGNCLDGCAAGFVGSKCLQSSQTEGVSPAFTAGVIVGVLLFVIIGAAAAVFTIIFIRKRREQAKQSSSSVKMTNSNSVKLTDRCVEAEGISNMPLSFVPAATVGASGNTRPQAIVKPARQKPFTKPEAKPAIKPKPTLPSKTRDTIYENTIPLDQTANTVPLHGAARHALKPSDTQQHASTHDSNKQSAKSAAPVNKPKKKPSLKSMKVIAKERVLEAETKGLMAPQASCEGVSSGDKSRSFQLDLLQQLVVERLSGEGLEEEFRRMEQNKEFPMKNGQRQANYYKNRFNSILPYDKNRVELGIVDRDNASDYINASFIQGNHMEKAFIAAQGPKGNTQNDFWRMVWQEGVTDIVMLTNLNEGSKEKCFKYWPAAPGSTLNTKHMKITMIEEEARAHFLIRTFHIQPDKGNDNPRCVTQYHYISWLDHEVPATTPLINFWRYVRERAPRTPSAPPLVVHCSAGVGRTGTYIALDIIFDQAQHEAEVSIYSVVDKLRDDRCCMVQNKGQYRFLHEAVLEAYTSRNTRMKVSTMDIHLSPNIHHKEPNGMIDAEFETLCKMQTCMAAATYTMANLEENRAKNRNPRALPDDKHLVFLTKHVRGRNQYINAVYMTTFLQHRGSIITQLPLPDTMLDLWRLVDGCDVNTIVSIGDVETGEQDCYWPKLAGSSIEMHPYVIKLQSTVKIGDTLWHYKLSLEKNGTTQDVCILHYDGWTGEVPDNMADLIHLLTILQTPHKDKGDKPVIVQCIDGSSRSGMICILWEMLSRMVCDSKLDVYLSVRQLHAVKSDVLLSVEQYRYCYEVARQFRDTCSIYSNTSF